MKKAHYVIFTKAALILILIIIFIVNFIKTKNVNADFKDLFSQNQCIEISNDPQKYITEKENTKQIFIEHMQNKGWTYLENEQLGAAYCFERKAEKSYFILEYHENYALWYLR